MSLIDPENCSAIVGGGRLGLLISRDHASNVLPQGYGSAGGNMAPRAVWPMGSRKSVRIRSGTNQVWMNGPGGWRASSNLL